MVHDLGYDIQNCEVRGYITLSYILEMGRPLRRDSPAEIVATLSGSGKNLPIMGKLIPNSFNLLVVVYVALGSTACSYGMAIIG